MPPGRIRSYCLRWIALCVLLLNGPALALEIGQLRFGAHPDKVRLVLDLSETTDFRVFVMGAPYRLVVDLPDFAWKAGQAGIVPEAGVTALRYGALQPGVSRIVFDMNAPVGVRDAFILPRQGDKPDRLVIDYARIPDAVFQGEKDKVHGTLAAGSHSTPPPEPHMEAPAEKPLIVIDPGHGGVDPGAMGKGGAQEKQVTLALARELKTRLEDTGRYRVLLTREKDFFIKLKDRVAFAAKNGASLFVSIHADSIGKSNVSGLSVYTLSEKASDEQTAKLADAENKVDLIAGIDLSAEDHDVASILVDLAMRDTMNQSNFFANKLVEKMTASRVALLESPHRSAGFAVLKSPEIPSILVEAGFISNKNEEKLLMSPAYRNKIAQALQGAIDAYFEQVRKNRKI